MTDGFEQHMRDVLHGDDGHAAGFSAAQVMAGGRQRRRARAAAVSGVALVAAGAVAVVPVALADGNGRGGAVSAASGQAAPVVGRGVAMPPSSAVLAAPVHKIAAPSVRVVPPGKVDLGGGYSMTLTADSFALTCKDGQSGPAYTDNGNQGAGTVGLHTCDQAVAGLYIGSGEAASAKITVDGKACSATVVTLAGHPGWSASYVVLPGGVTPTTNITISVFDASGHQLATFAPPAWH